MEELLLNILFWVLFIGGGIGLFFGSFFMVDQQEEAVVERFRRFVRTAKPGLNFKVPFIERVADEVNLRVQQLPVEVETKTEDNVFVKIKVAIQYQVADVYKAFYKLEDAEEQIEAFVFDVVRAQVPGIKLDDLFQKKDEIANAVREQLANIMDDFGYAILKAPVTDIDPDATVKASMNAINAAQRMRVAANEQGEAERILAVKRAEGDAASKALQGKGIADQRRAIVEGLQESISQFQEAVQGSTAKDVMALVTLTQYFDTLKEFAYHPASTKVILLPHSPGHASELMEQMRASLVTAAEATTSPHA